MPEIATETKNGITTILFSGNLDIRNSGDIREQLLQIEPETETVQLLLKDTDNIDLSFLQMVYALIKKMKAAKKKVLFSEELNEEYEKIVKESGFFDAFSQLIKQ